MRIYEFMRMTRNFHLHVRGIRMFIRGIRIAYAKCFCYIPQGIVC